MTQTQRALLISMIASAGLGSCDPRLCDPRTKVMFDHSVAKKAARRRAKNKRRWQERQRARARKR